MALHDKAPKSLAARLDSRGGRVTAITIADTLSWLGVTAAFAAIVGNSAALQIVSAAVFTALWFAAIKVWAR